jgi:hypothetical protein
LSVFFLNNKSLRTSKNSQDNEQRAIVDAAITLTAIAQQGLIPEDATTSGKTSNEESHASSTKRTKTS